MNIVKTRRWLAALAVLLAVLFLFRPGVQRLKNRIASTIGAALGRRVELGNVRIHVLPRPGFDLEDLIIHDDPAFGAEPMVRADEVSASIRLSSLPHGRIEIATLSATEPSINLVRNASGRWNLEGLLERTAQIPVAPTGKPDSERRPAFPYLEAGHARVNFKLGQEKKSYALTDAQVALWQDSENSWGARLSAQPVRTDFHLTDTGLLRVNATWQRAPSLDRTPMVAAISWEKGQLGQLTMLLTGQDRGWRGGVTLVANLTGTPEALVVRSQLTVDDFRRYDIVGGETVRLTTSCSAQYRAPDGTLRDLLCQSPVSTGTLRLRGDGTLGTMASPYDVTLEAEKIPLAPVLRLLRHAQKDLPSDLTAAGTLDAELHAQRGANGQVELSGKGLATEARLTSNGSTDDIALGDVPLALVDDTSAREKSIKGSRTDGEPDEPRLRVGPVPLDLGGAAPAMVGGWLSVSGYRLFARGDASVKKVFRLADTVGAMGARPAVAGLAKVDLNVAGTWSGLAVPVSGGSAQLRNVRLEIPGVNTPIEFHTAILSLAPDTASLEKMTAVTGETSWSGSVKVPRRCATDCAIQFDLAADQLSTGSLAEWFTQRAVKRPWYRLLTADAAMAQSPLRFLKARGTARVGRLEMKQVSATQISTQAEFDQGKLKLTDLSAAMFDGSQRGNWQIDLSAQPVTLEANGTLQNVSLAKVSAALGDTWVTGTAEGKFDLSGAGGTFADFLEHADGKLHFIMWDGAFQQVEIPGAPRPFPVHRFAADLTLDKGAWMLSNGTIDARDGLYQVSGRVSSGSGLDVVLSRNDAIIWNVTGSLAKPRVARGSRKQALK